jgi:hypothetical protein
MEGSYNVDRMPRFGITTNIRSSFRIGFVNRRIWLRRVEIKLILSKTHDIAQLSVRRLLVLRHGPSARQPGVAINVERGNITDKLQPRNIHVSFTNNSNVAIDVLIFTFYSDQLVIDVETDIVNK